MIIEDSRKIVGLPSGDSGDADIEAFVRELLVWLPEKFKIYPNFKDYVEALLQLIYEMRENISNFAKLYSPTDLEDADDIKNLETMFNLQSDSSDTLIERIRGLLYTVDFVRIKGLLQSVQYYLYKKRLSYIDLEMKVEYLWTGPLGTGLDYTVFIPQEFGEDLRSYGSDYYPTPHFCIIVTSGELSEQDKEELYTFIDRVRPIESVLDSIEAERTGLIPAVIVLPHGETPSEEKLLIPPVIVMKVVKQSTAGIPAVITLASP